VSPHAGYKLVCQNGQGCLSRRAADACQPVPDAMEPSLIAVIADPNAPLTAGMTKLLDAIDGAVAEVVVANSAVEFATKCGADKLAKVDVIVAAVFAGGQPKVVADLWPHCPAVKWIHSMAAGVDTLVPVLKPLPRIEQVPVTNAKGAFSRSLAEYALMAMLHYNKQVPRIQDNKKRKVWDKFIMGELYGMKVGFVGYGDIAQTTAALCKAFGMKILALRRRKGLGGDKVESDETFGIDDPVERLKLFAESDFVVCSLPGSPETKHFCSTNEFEAMKKTGVFISLGRGMCVDEEALVQALKASGIAGAALDVFETEPLPEASPVWEAPNLMITAHNADLVETYMEDSWNVFQQRLADYRKAPADFKGTVSLELGY